VTLLLWFNVVAFALVADLKPLAAFGVLALNLAALWPSPPAAPPEPPRGRIGFKCGGYDDERV